ncbi:hypothetical protein BDZ90DRAFT_231295 [Jaminaea rosea]|uniref:Uncharacterized protein n=1 Tax=Jaminaea rosea TaxID=1569628 RepID=A0A316USP5_9BASI|nr:hypothetical protein BDZ90DRAFT_231295 [Jaminaea rosea]PWN28300.1 hypothetical protein BDZ90DRAFT_231295 [Jaminaea rosea]
MRLRNELKRGLSSLTPPFYLEVADTTMGTNVRHRDLSFDYSSPAASNLLSSLSYQLASSPLSEGWANNETQDASDETIVALTRPTTPGQPPQQTDVNGGGNTFFEDERRRLTWDIADSLEAVLTQVNAINRNLEDWIRVRPLIDDSSELYNQFVALLRRLRLDGFDGEEHEGQQVELTHSRNDLEKQHQQEPRTATSLATDREQTMTEIVAPGGGSWNPRTSTRTDATVAVRSRGP